MEKDFADWHRVKQNIQDYNQHIFVAEREVRWCSVGLNVGSEMDGNGARYSRPILIIKKMTPNTCLCIPLTTKQRQRLDFLEIDLGDGVLRMAILSQIKLIDTKRLRETMAIISEDQFRKIKRAVIGMLE